MHDTDAMVNGMVGIKEAALLVYGAPAFSTEKKRKKPITV